MSDIDELRPGEGNATKVSVSLPEGTVAAVRKRVGSREFSSYVAEAIEQQLRRQVLAEVVAEHETENGPVPERSRKKVRSAWHDAERRHAEWSVKQSA
ncbi:hypothetical protein [Actinorugispora endophytica]|uniref:Uncharacterized protein n=1 Tax=Actinorugispora endophytica TaxID=1605990 RepID=A0A4R6V139_9ACTN|nr:hypothetical protein [Actinorugispora endophytica]TDQ53593.1 hypothetical protein EV190_10340 [Actinorugispora endophytica]